MQRLLLAKMLLAKSNFQVLHWKCCGDNFDTIHRVTGEYYDMIEEDLDEVAEIVMRQGMCPVNYCEVISMIQEHEDCDHCCLQSCTNYNSDVAWKICNKIWGDLISEICCILESDEMEETINIGIKSFYESLLDKYDKERRYLNSRRMVD